MKEELFVLFTTFSKYNFMPNRKSIFGWWNMLWNTKIGSRKAESKTERESERNTTTLKILWRVRGWKKYKKRGCWKKLWGTSRKVMLGVVNKNGVWGAARKLKILFGKHHFYFVSVTCGCSINFHVWDVWK